MRAQLIKIVFLFSFGSLFTGLLHAQTPTTACATAAGNKLTVGGACGTGTISDNTLDGPFPSCGADARDGWFWFTATATSHIVTVSSSNRQLLLQVLSGPCGGPYVEIGCGNTNLVAGAQTETATVATTIGTNYLVRVVNQASNVMTLTSACVTVAPDPCLSIVTVAACGTSVTANLSGAGSGWNTTSCGFTTSGAEQIYSFTPSVTGIYSINITAASGGFIDYFWINSTSGCGSGAPWTCIQDIISTGTYGSMSWTAGQTYYILLNSESTTAASQTFNIGCPAADPCLGIINIAACGTSVTANLSGAGAGWNTTACGFTTSGAEQIYSFTPTITGTYSINVTSASGGYIDYFWINSASGCSSAAAWTCMQDVISAGTYGSMSWTAGQTYYILLNAESTTASSQTFNISCTVGTGADPCLGITSISPCGTSVTANLNGSGAGWNTTACGFTTSGAEVIYSFTPTITGTYNINVTSASGGYIDYFWINSTSGCSSAAPWNCIQDVISGGSYGSMSWTAGQTYYILLNSESTTAASQTFNIPCPGTAVTASDCSAAVNVCTSLTFAVDPSGFGTINEIPALGTTGNPNLVGGDAVLSSWGSDHWGCLRSGELNSTWMVVNIATSGVLQFSFGTAGGAFNCYDWIMYPYNSTACTQIPTGTYAPIRCNWNSPCAAFTGISTTPPAGGAAGNFEPDLAVTAGQQYIICFSNYSSAFTSVPLNFFGTASVSCTPLPIELTSFNGYKKEDDVLLNWHTQSEKNVSYYTVMHSIDGINFSPIGNVAVQPGDAPADYDFTHLKPAYGMNYYLLLMVDADNKTQQSGTLAIDFMQDDIVIGDIHPNPSAGLSYITINSKAETDMYIVISDISGKVVREQKLNLIKGSNPVEINTGLLSKGIYHFTVSNPGTVHARVQKLVVE
jgi:hypothetical protein